MSVLEVSVQFWHPFLFIYSINVSQVNVSLTGLARVMDIGLGSSQCVWSCSVTCQLMFLMPLGILWTLRYDAALILVNRWRFSIVTIVNSHIMSIMVVHLNFFWMQVFSMCLILMQSLYIGWRYSALHLRWRIPHGGPGCPQLCAGRTLGCHTPSLHPSWLWPTTLRRQCGGGGQQHHLWLPGCASVPAGEVLIKDHVLKCFWFVSLLYCMQTLVEVE